MTNFQRGLIVALVFAVSVAVDWTVPAGSGTAPAFDGNGNMTSDGTYGNRTYAYDTLGRLVSVTSGGATTTYTLDGSGNRWSQTTGAATTNFDLDLLASNPTILADGTTKYLPGAPGAGYESAGTWQNAITDAIGSPILYVDTAGATSGLAHYDPYGVARPGSTAGVGIGYAGEYRDATGLVNLRARSYDPVLGRFIGRDTYGGVASAPQTGNRYAYATANPFRYTDPSGHFVQTVIANPYSVLELAVTFNPLGAALVFGYQLATGTDPATGEPADPFVAAAGLGVVVGLPVVTKLLSKALTGLVKGLGHAVGSGIERALGAGKVFGRGVSAFGGKALSATKALPGRARAVLGEGIAALEGAWAGRARLFGNEFGHLRLGRASALETSGRAGLPNQLHHVASNKSTVYSPRMEAVARRYGLELDQDWNTGVLPHLGRHPNEYHEFVLLGMQKAALEAGTDRDVFLQLFERYVKEPIQANPELLRRSGWL